MFGPLLLRRGTPIQISILKGLIGVLIVGIVDISKIFLQNLSLSDIHRNHLLKE